MEQDQLFHEDINEALKTTVLFLGGAKKVGCDLWPDKSPSRAAEHLNNCLNPVRAEKLDHEQIIYLIKRGRQAGCHAAMNFIAGECGYDCKPIEPDDEKAKLQRDFVQATKELMKLSQKLDSFEE